MHSISFKNLTSLAGHIFNPFPLKHYCCMTQHPFKNSLDERLNYPQMLVSVHVRMHKKMARLHKVILKKRSNSLSLERVFLVTSFDGRDETSLVQNVEMVHSKQGRLSQTNTCMYAYMHIHTQVNVQPTCKIIRLLQL